MIDQRFAPRAQRPALTIAAVADAPVAIPIVETHVYQFGGLGFGYQGR